MAGARHFTELVSWQLADEIRTAVYPLTERPVFARDTRLRAQTDDAIESVCRNIAEGFGCESHAEFHRYLVIARRSLNELFDSLRAAEIKRHVTTQDLVTIRALGRRLYPAMAGLMRHLRHPSPLPNSPGRIRSTRKSAVDGTDQNRNRTDK
jgi:four helix bundle protein